MTTPPFKERRSLVEGLNQTPPALESTIEKDFVFHEKKRSNVDEASTTTVPNKTIAKSPISTRIRADINAALKRASLERQLNGIEPNTIQDILEQTLEPWLKANGYLP